MSGGVSGGVSGPPGWSSGDVIRVRSLAEGQGDITDFIVDMKGKSFFSLAYMSKPYHRINITSSGEIEVRNCIGKHSFWSIDGVDGCYRFKSASMIKLKSNKDSTPQGSEKFEEHFYLVMNILTNKFEVVAESIMLNSTFGQTYCTTFKIEVCRDFSYSNVCMSSSRATNNTTMSKPKVLKKWDKDRLRREGYLHLSNVIISAKVFECRHLLTHSLGVPGSISPGGTQEGLGKLGGYLSNCEAVRSLLLHPETNKGSNVSLLNIVEELLGEGRGDLRSISGQIALRFPEYVENSLVCSAPTSFLQLPDGSLPIGSAWHTDGLRQGKYHGFSLLVGICLSDCLEDFAGNLLVWPGSHVPIHETLRGPHGGLDLDLLAALIQKEEELEGGGSKKGIVKTTINANAPACTDADTSNNGVVNKRDTINDDNALDIDRDTDMDTNTAPKSNSPLHDNSPRNLPSLGLPLQLHLRAGDVVLVHPDTAHCGGPNFSSVIRNMLYFRIKCCDIRDNDDLYRHNMWVDMPGI